MSLFKINHKGGVYLNSQWRRKVKNPSNVLQDDIERARTSKVGNWEELQLTAVGSDTLVCLKFLGLVHVSDDGTDLMSCFQGENHGSEANVARNSRNLGSYTFVSMGNK